MKKKLVLITYESIAKEKYMDQLRGFFGDYIDIKGYSVKDDIITEKLDADLVLISFSDVTNYVTSYIPQNAAIAYITRTFTKSKIALMQEIPKDSNVLLVDYSEITANETLGILHEMGFNNINFSLVYPEINESVIVESEIAITPGYSHLAPPTVKKIVDIGWYSISLLCFADIINKLVLVDEAFDEKIYKYSQEVIPTNLGLVNLIKHTWEIQNQWNTILNIIDDGVIVMNADNQIVHYNCFIQNMLGKTDLLDSEYAEFWKTVNQGNDISNVFIKIKDKSFLVTKKLIYAYDDLIGSMIILKDITMIQELENKLRTQQAKRGLNAQYSFDKIITESEVMIDCINKAKKIAKTDASVLITGETGVGKELFAQSIHNYSNRSHMPFLAINCAALPVDLLESELFGYEEGAFTGAKKGGKIGLFELAHKGTIFLDEIGELPLDVQAKLLRMIQEKEVIRIGGDTVTTVDVRVITATNVSLPDLIKERKFRKDLYFRLNIMNVHIPELKKRKGDVIILAEFFLRSLSKEKKVMSNELKEALETIIWEGNIRELKNCMEYMSIMGDGEILNVGDLPDYIKLQLEYNEAIPSDLFGFLPEEKKIAEHIIDALRFRNLGRRKLYNILQAEGISTSEYEIRNIMRQLEARGIIKIDSGRKGAKLITI